MVSEGLRRAEAGRYDLVVLGGGILGAFCALDARLRGLDVLLVEARDWGSGTSSMSSKLIHGGLRYLERLDLRLVRAALTERRILQRIAPHLVRPLRFLTPHRPEDRVGRLRLRLGLWLYDRLAGGGGIFGASRGLDRETARKLAPALRTEGLQAASEYGDALTDDARLTLAVVRAAAASGALLLRPAEALAVDRQDGDFELRLADGEGEARVRARTVVMAVGPWRRRFGAADRERLVKGSHLVLPALPGDRALFLQVPDDGRIVFVIPWYGRSLLGTTEVPFEGDPRHAAISPEETAYLLRAANRALDVDWTEATVQGSFAGVRAIREAPGRSATALSRDFALHESRPGLIHPEGGKLTTARLDAERTIDRVLQRLGRPPQKASTANHLLPGAWDPEDATPVETLRALGRCRGLSEETMTHLLSRYGLETGELLAAMADDPGGRERLRPDLPFIRTELDFGRQKEGARDREDLLRRRLPLAVLGPIDPALDARAGSALRAAGPAHL